SPPAWEAAPPLVSGKGRAEDVEVDAGGTSFRISNVPAGEWEVSLRSARREVPPGEAEATFELGDGWERWSPPRLRPSPAAVKVRAGETTPLALLVEGD
ncbi:MAG: hypothetical protein ACREIU_07940, partial [Planctomycetota bacterium]